MNEKIGKYLTSLCEEIVPFYLSEAETKTYPYAVYEQTVQTFYTKDGVYKFTADSYIRVYSKDFDEAQAKVELIQAAIAAHVDSAFVIQQRAINRNCVNSLWVIELLYFVKQTN